MVLQHCSNCDGRHPPPLDEVCPFLTCEQPAPKRTTRRTRRSPSLSPPPPPKRGRGQPRGSMSPSLTPPPPPKRGRGRPLGSKGNGKKAPPRRHQSPEASFDAQDQPDSPHSSACPTPRDSGMQPPCAPQPVDPQVAAIQAITDQLARMQQEARDYQAAAARDREADRQEMLRRTAAAQPAPGPSHPDVALARPPYPPASASQESRRTTAGRPAPGTSHEDPALSRYRQLLAAYGAPATQPAPSSTQGCVAPASTHTRDRLAAASAPAPANGPPGPDILPDGDETISPPHSSPFRPTS